MKPSRALGVAAVVSVAVVFLFLTSAAAPAMSSSQQANAFTSQTNLLPGPTLNTNITWSNFYNGWKPLEYSNGSANLTINAGLSTIYNNPITINPTHIVSNGTLTWDKPNGHKWDNYSWFIPSTEYGGAIATSKAQTSQEVLTLNSSKIQGNYMNAAYTIDTSELPSDNIQYDYLTVIMGLQAPNTTGISGALYLWNSTSHGSQIGNSIYPGQTYYLSENLQDIEKNIGYQTTYNISGHGKTTSICISPEIFMPKINGSSETATLTVYGLAVSTYPLSLGTNSTGQAITYGIGNIKLDNFDPSFKWTEVSNGGYSVAVSQPLQNLTNSQNAISDGNYIEQVEYQGSFQLPTAPDLTYGPASISEQFNVSTSQTQVLDINGVSYLSEISGKNGTVTLLSSGNPNSQTQFLQIVDYTQSQWNSISSPPGIFSIAGIEYYWWIAVGGLATLIGLAGAAKHAGTKADQERIRRGGGGR